MITDKVITMHKKRICMCCFALLGLLTGCSSSDSLIKAYNDTALENKRLIIKMNQEDHMDFFASDLVVFPKTAIAVEETKEIIEETSESKSKSDSENVEPLIDNDAVADETVISSNNVLLAGIDTLEDIYEKNIYDRIYPASVTKILTALVTIQNANFNDTVTFTEDMVVTDYGAKLCGFEVGDVLTVEQLFTGLMVYSGNDAANALAIHIGGSIEGFSDIMNNEAKRLGCVDTHFTNPSGLHDNEHYTSAYDLYLIFNECLKYEKFQHIIRQNSCDIEYKDANGEIVEATYKTTNQYFTDAYDYPENIRVLGGKTGTTDQAGCCLILYDVDSDDNGYVSLVLGADNYDTLYSEMNILLNKITK